MCWPATGSFNVYAFALGTLCVLGLAAWPKLFAGDSRFRKSLETVDTVSALNATSRIPAPVVVLVTLSLLAWALHLPVETIGTRFGGIPQGVPSFELPDFSWETVKQLVTPTLTIALLGAIECCCVPLRDTSSARRPSTIPTRS